jgi:hydrogenase-4 component E
MLPAVSPEILMEFCITLALITGIFILACRKVETMVHLFALQSLGLALIGFVSGILHHSPNVWLVAVLTLSGKCLLIPLGLLWVARQIHPKVEIESHLTFPLSTLLGAAACTLAFYITHYLQLHDSAAYSDLLGTFLSLLLLGLFTMTTHKNAMSEVMGLYMLDNGIFCLATATIFEMPLIVEMGILLELLLSALVMGIWVFRIKRSFNSINVEQLNQLRG